MSIQRIAKRQNAVQNPFVDAGRAAIKKAGEQFVMHNRDRRHGIGQVKIVNENTTYSFFDFVISEPMLQLGFSQQKIKEATDGMPINEQSREVRYFKVEGLRNELKARQVHFGRPEMVYLPKPIWDGRITADNMKMRWSSKSVVENDPNKKRPITIQPQAQRIVAHAFALALNWFLEAQWDNCVVACRPGVSVGLAVSSLRQAFIYTGRKSVLAADITGFFDHVPLDRCKTILDQVSGFKDDKDLLWLFQLLMANDGRVLPQGSPLSPILANLYAQHTIDRECKRLGPYLRYVDDVLILGESNDEIKSFYNKISKSQVGNGLQLSPKKSFGYDLSNNSAFSLIGDEYDQGAPFQYLGIEIKHRRDKNDLDFRLSDRALLRLYETMRYRFFNKFRYCSPESSPGFGAIYKSCSYLMIGWLQFFGCCEISKGQHAVIDWIAEQTWFTAESLGREMDLRTRKGGGRDQKDIEESEQRILRDVALVWCRPMAESEGPINREELFRRIKSVDQLIGASSLRFKELLEHPLDLAWHKGREVFHTIHRPHQCARLRDDLNMVMMDFDKDMPPEPRAIPVVRTGVRPSPYQFNQGEVDVLFD